MSNLYGKRILIIGSSSSGKTTFSRELAKLTGLPLIHLDQYYWKPGWQPAPKEEWLQQVTNLIGGESWIMDGNYSGTMDIRMERADTIIYLDFNRVICLAGCLKRLLSNWGRARLDMHEGCNEKMDLEFLKYIWSFPKEHAPRIRERLKKHVSKTIVVLKSRKEAGEYLRKLAENE